MKRLPIIAGGAALSFAAIAGTVMNLSSRSAGVKNHQVLNANPADGDASSTRRKVLPQSAEANSVPMTGSESKWSEVESAVDWVSSERSPNRPADSGQPPLTSPAGISAGGAGAGESLALVTLPPSSIPSRSARVQRKLVTTFETRAALPASSQRENAAAGIVMGAFEASLAQRTQLSISTRAREQFTTGGEGELVFAAVDSLIAAHRPVPAAFVVTPALLGESQLSRLYTATVSSLPLGSPGRPRVAVAIDYVGLLPRTSERVVEIPETKAAPMSVGFTWSLPAVSPGQLTQSVAEHLDTREYLDTSLAAWAASQFTRSPGKAGAANTLYAAEHLVGLCSFRADLDKDYYYVHASDEQSGFRVDVNYLGTAPPVRLVWPLATPAPVRDWGDFVIEQAAVGDKLAVKVAAVTRTFVERIDWRGDPPAALVVPIKEAIARYAATGAANCEIDLRIRAAGAAESVDEYYVTLRFQPAASLSSNSADVIVDRWGAAVPVGGGRGPTTQVLAEVFGVEFPSASSLIEAGVLEEERAGTHKQFSAEELACFESLFMQLPPERRAALRGLRLVRLSRPAVDRKWAEGRRTAGYTLRRGSEVTIYIYDDAYAGSSEFRVVNEITSYPWVAMTIAHELAHALATRSDVQRRFNAEFSDCAACLTWYARDEPLTEMFPEAFAMYMLDRTWLQENYPAVAEWFERWASNNDAP